VRARYGDAMILSYRKRNYNRRAVASIEDALVDLLHLAQTEEVRGDMRGGPGGHAGREEN
jgi:hypothetical protein